MLIQIITHTPTWVWGLLTALLALGLWQTRTQRVTRARLLALPLALLGLGLWTLGPGFVAVPLAALLWLAALGLGSTLGQRLPPQPGTLWLAAERRLRVPGSWLPLGVISAIFSLRYAMGVGVALHPAWRTAPQVQLPAALLLGAISGLLLGRALGLLKLTRQGRDTMAADETAHA